MHNQRQVVGFYAMVSLGFLAIASLALFAVLGGNRGGPPHGEKFPNSVIPSDHGDFSYPSSRKLGTSIDGSFPSPHEPRFMDTGMLDEEAGGDGSKTLVFRLVHRNALESPARKVFSSMGLEIMDLIQVDEMRVQGFSVPAGNAPSDSSYYGSVKRENVNLVGSPAAFPAMASSPSALPPATSAPAAPSPSPEGGELEEFHGRVTSGASLPGNIGQYFVEFYLGNPPQRFLSIADTGSDLVWVPCSHNSSASSLSSPPLPSPSPESSTPMPRPSSPPPGVAFFPEISSTFTPIPCTSQECDLVPAPLGATCPDHLPTACTYAYGYSDRTQTTGVFGYDTVTMRSYSGATVQIKNVAFGCGINNTGPSITEVGGVIGLGQGPISFSSQLGYLYGNKFSYCFTSFFHRRASSALVFGGHLMGAKLMGHVQYTPLLTNTPSDTFYYIGIDHVKVAGRHVPIHRSVWGIHKNGVGGTVIDSGTTLSFFLEPAYNAMVGAFKASVPYPVAPKAAGLDLCYNVSGIRNPELPRLSIVFKGGAVFRPPTGNYFLSPTEDLRCLALMGNPAVTVLGNLMQQHYYVEYDRFHNRIGFARAHCSL